MARYELSNEPNFVRIGPAIAEKQEQIVRRRLRHFFDYISGTGSLRHNPFKLDQWHFKCFQMSSSLFKSVQPSLRKVGTKIMLRNSAHTYTHTYTQIHTHTQTFSDLVELSRMVLNTRGLRSSDQKLVFQAILYPFYRKRQKGSILSFFFPRRVGI